MGTNGEDTVRAAPSRATLDPGMLAALNDLLGNDAETLRDVVTAFVEDGPDRLREIRDGNDRGDHALVRRAAHTLKSSGLTFGAVDLAAASRALEDAAHDGLEDETLVARVEAEWQRVLPAIRELGA